MVRRGPTILTRKVANEVPLTPQFIAKLLRRFLLRDKKGKGKLRYREILGHVLLDTELWALGDKGRMEALASIDGDHDGFLTPTETVLAQFMISAPTAYEPLRSLEKRTTLHGDHSDMRVSMDDVFGILQLRSVVMLRSRLERSGKPVLLSDYELVQEMDERWDQIRAQEEKEYNEALQRLKEREEKEAEELAHMSPVAAWAKVHSVVAIGSILRKKGPPHLIRTDSPTGASPPPQTNSGQQRVSLSRRLSAAFLGDGSVDPGRQTDSGVSPASPSKLSSLIRRNLVSGPRRQSLTPMKDAGTVVDILSNNVRSVRRRRLRSAEAVLDSTPLEPERGLLSASGMPASPPRTSPAPPDRNESPTSARSGPLDDSGAQSPGEEKSFSSLPYEKESDEYIGTECDAFEKELKKIFNFYCQKIDAKDDELLIGHAGFRGLVSDVGRFEADNIPMTKVDDTFMYACEWNETIPKTVEELREEAAGTPKVPRIPLGMTYSQFRNRAVPRLAKVLMPSPPEEFMGHRRDYNRVATFCRFILMPMAQRNKADPLLNAFYNDDVLAQIKLYRGVLQSIFAHYASLDMFLVAWDKMDPELHNRSWGPGNGKLVITEKEFLTMLDNFGIIGMRSRLESRDVVFSKTMGLHVMSCTKRGPEGHADTEQMVFSEFIEALLRIAVILFPLPGMKYEDLEAGPISLFTDSDRDAARLGPLRNLVPNKWNMHDDRLHRRSHSSLGMTSPSPSEQQPLTLSNLGAFKFERTESSDAAALSFARPFAGTQSPLRPVQPRRPSTIGETMFHRETIQKEAAYRRASLLPPSVSEQGDSPPPQDPPSRSTPILRGGSSRSLKGSTAEPELERSTTPVDFSKFSRALLRERTVVRQIGGSPLAISSGLEKRALPSTLQRNNSLASLPPSASAAIANLLPPRGARSLPAARSLPSPPAEGTRSGAQSQVRFSLTSPYGGSQARDKSQMSVEELMEEKLLMLSQGNLAKVNHRIKRNTKPGLRKAIVHKTAHGPVLVTLPRDVFQPWQRNI